MSLNTANKTELSSLLSSVTLDKLTQFPISNTQNIPIAYMNYEVVLKTRDKVYGFSLEEAIAESKHVETVIILDKNGMHFFYTQSKSKQQLWMPSVYDTVKETEGTVLVSQQFPTDGECLTRHVLAKDIEDDSIKEFLDKDLIIFNDANFYIHRENLANISKIANHLWSQDMLLGGSGLTTLQNHN